MTISVKWTTGACAGLGLTLCLVALPAALWAEGWRLPFAGKPQVIAPQGTAPETAKGWALPVASVRLVDVAKNATLRPAPREVAPLLTGPTAILTGFSGHIYGRPLLPANARPAAQKSPDYQTIDLDGISVSLSNISDFGRAPMGQEVIRALTDALYARQIGQVFGAVLDDADQPNLYLAATSAYGVQIVGADANADGLPDRLKQGRADARFMAGQWGDGAGPRTIWRVDGTNGKVEVFANLAPSDSTDTVPSLGNLAYDVAHRALFASDLQTGLITRFALDGRRLDSFDHGSTARPLAGLDAAPMDPKAAIAITDPAFDPIDPATWGMAAEMRRVWGLTVHQGRLYYSVASGQSPRPELWSVGLIRETGAFAADARWELTLPETLPAYEISDIGFADTGAVVLAQRGPRMLAYDFSKMAEVGRAEVVRFVLESPIDNPETPSIWETEATPYAVGFADRLSNTTGGIAFGPGYDAQGRLDFSQCNGTLWTTGEALRRAPELPLAKGGSLVVDGVQAQPAALMRRNNTPPWISYSLDYDRKYPSDLRMGYLGDVVVYGCAGGQQTASDLAAVAPPIGPPVTGDPPIIGDPLCKGASCILLVCLLNPSLCKPPPPDQVCAQSAVDVKCDGNGGYLANITYAGAPANLGQIKLTDPSGQITSLPQTQTVAGQFNVPLTGLVAGQVGQINLCSFDPTADGAPHDCCNTTVSFKIPSNDCKPEVQE